MKSLISTIAILLVFALTIRSGEAIACYRCTSATDTSCGDPFVAGQRTPTACYADTTQVGDKFGEIAQKTADQIISGFGINTQPTECIKIITKEPQTGAVIVTRDCATVSCETLKLGGKLIEECHTCKDSDACNGVSIISPFKSILAFLTVYIFIKFF